MPDATRTTLVALGDIAIARSVEAPVPAWLRRADTVFGNVEIALTDRGEPQDKALCLRADPALASDLAALPLHVATVANNHAFDFGATGLFDTLDALRGAGIAAVGGGADEQEALARTVVEASGLSVGFLGLSCTLPNGSSAGPRRAGIAGVRIVARHVVDAVTMDETPGMAPYVETECLPDELDRVRASVAAAKDGVDLLVVGIHWGISPGWRAAFQGWLADYQQPLGRVLVDAGADAVVGHHAHVVHGVELYRGKPILYGLGNFLFHGLFGDDLELGRTYPPYALASLQTDLERVGAVAELEWRHGALQEGPRVLIRPVRLDEAGEPAPAEGEEALAALERLCAMSESVATSLRIVETPDGPAVEAVGVPS
jgi:hypothetical protein